MFGKIALAATTASLVLGLGVAAHAADFSVAATAHFNGVTTGGVDPDVQGTVTFVEADEAVEVRQEQSRPVRP